MKNDPEFNNQKNQLIFCKFKKENILIFQKKKEQLALPFSYLKLTRNYGPTGGTPAVKVQVSGA